MNKKITLNIQIASKKIIFLPKKCQYLIWIRSSLMHVYQSNIKVLIRIVEKSEIKSLNYKFRQKNKATNILSFSYINDKMIDKNYIGDLIICSEIVTEEAKKKNVTLESHWAHITIHGILHLLGYNHDNLNNRIKMEYLETKIMASLNYKNPYIY
ncbi:hypothetical protein YbeY [Buchnera aphidicola str. Bp (Baizongia pistaciae)]|uniref:Endoribonuclease YbeY n=1 Tax=Buchnera aphidicola subsp. Baizongia pistaciae (strain Bp) TaxID=224915 RepID=YBEY_BUCBP|nr:rRNA maturation RNase YbeY [Buchnera aphidicola]P59478.1 RecName: Full=Endoribonuclease YbeY [Buchnera aphidicola str. Bp (Baizongia pistaciae)]AAO27105.1 hypothetical protein YbeY [Buchnera aphidicola str. Bp (Baizongia pistaciae)]